MNVQAGMGHNEPPFDANPIGDRLSEQYAELVERKDQLTEALDRVPEDLDTDDAVGKAGDFVRQLQACTKKAETFRVSEKEPYLSGGKAVDAWFNAIKTELAQAKKTVQTRLDKALKKKADEEKKRQQEEAERIRKAEEAARARAQTVDEFEESFQREAEADTHEKAAKAKPAEHARTRGEMGSVSTLQTRWVGEVTDYDKLDLETLRPFISRDALDKAVNAFVKAGNKNLTGAKIEEKSTARVS